MGETAGKANEGLLLPDRALELSAHSLQVTRIRHSLFFVFVDYRATERLLNGIRDFASNSMTVMRWWVEGYKRGK